MTNPTLAITGSGTTGPIVDWSVTEEATPISIADTSGGVGSMNLTAASTDDSIYLNDCLAGFTHGSRAFSGRVQSAQITGARVDVTVESALRVLNAVRTAPPVGRWVLPVTAVGGYGSGDGQFIYPGDVVFDSSGNMFVADRGNYRIQKFTPDGNGGWTYAAQVGSQGSGNGQFLGSGGGSVPSVGWLAVDSSGNVYATDTYGNRVQKFTNNLVYSAQVGSSGSGNGQFTLATGIAIDASNNVYVRDYGNLRIQRFNTSLTYQAQFAIPANGNGFSWDAVTGDLFITLFSDGVTSYHNVRRYSTAGVYSGNATPGGIGTNDGYFAPRPGVAPINTQNPQDIVTLSDGTVVVSDLDGARIQFFDSTLAFVGKFGSYGTGDGEFKDPRGLGVDADDNIYVSDHGNHRIQVFSRAALTNTVPLSEAFATYVALADDQGTLTVSYEAASDPEVAFPGWTDSVWTKLKQLCAAYRLEMRFVNGTLTIDDVGARTIDITNKSVPTVTPASVMPARGINVINQNIMAGNGLVMYDAAEFNTFHQVAVAATTQVTVATNNHPAYLNNPVPVDAAPIGSGQYAIQDSTGAAVTAAVWTAAGGYVVANVGNTPGTIDITLHGPDAEISGFTGPYSLASGSGTSRTPTLSISGSGVTTSPETEFIPTGADAEQVTNETVRTVDIPFIDGLERAYDAGVQAAATQLFTQTVTLTIPHDPTRDFGDVVGRKFRLGDAFYRVTKAVHKAAGVDITAAWHTTVGDVDTIWDGQTVGDVDDVWELRPLRDHNATPLKTA